MSAPSVNVHVKHQSWEKNVITVIVVGARQAGLNCEFVKVLKQRTSSAQQLCGWKHLTEEREVMGKQPGWRKMRGNHSSSQWWRVDMTSSKSEEDCYEIPFWSWRNYKLVWWIYRGSWSIKLHKSMDSSCLVSLFTPSIEQKVVWKCFSTWE